MIRSENLINRLEKLKKMGAKAKKAIPKIIQRAIIKKRVIEN
jgi:hypothetical protein